MTVAMVITEVDRLTGLLEKRSIPEQRVVQALMALGSEESLVVLTNTTNGKSCSTRHVTSRTLVLMVPPYHDVRDAFLPRDGASFGVTSHVRAGVNCGFVDKFGNRAIGRASPRLVITDRVRRAVLEPLESVHLGDAALGL